ncbi:MAG: YrzE family protein [Lachnospiraceae bacterium]|nr:YrzE family protein [Lachnospiraceae bacterium]
MKKAIIKGLIVGVVFFAALFIISSIMNKGNADMTMEMSDASYPTVSVWYAGEEINVMHGYAKAMEVSHMRQNLTPLGSGRKLNLRIYPYDVTIADIVFEVRTLDGERLIESTQVSEYEEADGRIDLSVSIKDLIETNQEYMFVLILTLENGQEIRYYTRVIYAEGYYAGEKLEYVVDFSAKTFHKESAKELTKYLESNSEGDNTTFGKVDIHSSFSQVTWGDLRVTKESDVAVSVKELAPQTGSFELEYYVSTREGRNKTYYRIKEYYRVRYTPERMYLLDFNRTMDQIFNKKGEVYGNNKIMLGITSEEIQMMESDGGNILAFVTGNRLFSYNAADNKLALLFGFYDDVRADERTLFDGHKIKILNVDEIGNVTFLVYGYMNRGRHEGEVGISAYFYDSMVNTVEELVYIPSDRAEEILVKEVDEMSYINRHGILYLMWGNQLYGVNSVDRTCEVIASNLAEGSYEISDSNRMVVWQTGSSAYESRELVLMNLNTGNQVSIKAGAGEVVRPIGFIGEDLIYGIAKRSDIVKDYAGNIIFPMYSVKILNETEGVLMTYEQENVYVIAGEISENQIILSRVEKTEEGTYEAIANDQIMNAEVEETRSNGIEIAAVDVYEKLTQIALKSKIDVDTIMHLTPKEVLFEGGREIELTEPEDAPERYYVYGKDGVEGIFMDEGNAVDLAYEKAGVVINEEGACVWLKGNRSTKNQIMAITGEAETEENSSLAVCLDTMLAFEGVVRNSQYMLDKGESVLSILENGLEDYEVLDLTGCPLDAVLYYVNQDIPVLATLHDGSAVLVIGFNEQNTVVMNPEKGTVYKVGMNDSTEWFEQNGNCFITYIRNDK